MFRYVAEDWHGNKAECRFLVSVKVSGNKLLFRYIVLVIQAVCELLFLCVEKVAT